MICRRNLLLIGAAALALGSSPLRAEDNVLRVGTDATFPPMEFTENGKRAGFENHLNYFHENGEGLPLDLAKGLAAFLNSDAVDQYFRIFSGHTQVNATDLRNLH